MTQNGSNSLCALIAATLLFMAPAAHAGIFSDDKPACTVTVVSVKGQTANVCYKGPKGNVAEVRNCMEMDAAQVPKAAHMLGCNLNS